MPAAAAYSGPERRYHQRRQESDRRNMIRFELDKPPRRSGRERRRSLGNTDIWKGRENF